MESIGGQLRQARLAAGLSLREMARRVGVSASMVSQVENSRVKPSVGTLYSMASELGVTLNDLMPVDSAEEPPGVPDPRLNQTDDPASALLTAQRDADSPVQRASTRHQLRMGLATWGRLTADHDPDNDFLHVTYGPGGESCAANDMIHHRGREYGFVISGTLHVQVGFAHYELHAGDSISFESMTPHRLSNPFDTDTTSIWLVVGRGGTPVL